MNIPETLDFNAACIGLQLKTTAGREALKIALENVVLLDNKQLDYGPHNISKYGAFGCIVRINDKLERLTNLYNKRRKKTINESVEDSFRDLSNYAIIALLCEKGLWPAIEKDNNDSK